jgi:disulfide bond formation protein DsbB
MGLFSNPRLANVAGLLACAGLLGYAIYAEHVLGLEPCPLCIFQRVAVFALGVVFALAAMHRVGLTGRRLYAAAIAVVSAAGAMIAGRHIWLQGLPPDQVPACGPGLNFILEAFPFAEAMDMVLSGSGECAEIEWTLLGLSMPAWVLVSVATLGAFGFAVNWMRPERRPATSR